MHFSIAGTRTARKQRYLLQTQRRQFEEEIDAYNVATGDSVTQRIIFDLLKDNVMSQEKSVYWEVRSCCDFFFRPFLAGTKKLDFFITLFPVCKALEELMLLEQDISLFIASMQRMAQKFHALVQEKLPASITHYCEWKVCILFV